MKGDNDQINHHPGRMLTASPGESSTEDTQTNTRQTPSHISNLKSNNSTTNSDNKHAGTLNNYSNILQVSVQEAQNNHKNQKMTTDINMVLTCSTKTHNKNTIQQKISKYTKNKPNREESVGKSKVKSQGSVKEVVGETPPNICKHYKSN